MEAITVAQTKSNPALVHEADDETGGGVRKVGAEVCGSVGAGVGIGVGGTGAAVGKSLGDSVGDGVGTTRRGTSTGGQAGAGVCRRSGNSSICVVSPSPELPAEPDA